jgi:hypothetical protein
MALAAAHSTRASSGTAASLVMNAPQARLYHVREETEREKKEKERENKGGAIREEEERTGEKRKGQRQEDSYDP